ncbi:uncharacterized protein LOC135498948 isoform X2 [Lineus longissimus]|uniref:uncharacterized protein LOC135498948 isoform X2 n=1 Tax=Lineus longissimus TaxID=88925 RepID=UPI00315D8DC5
MVLDLFVLHKTAFAPEIDKTEKKECLPPARQRGATGPQEYGVEANDGATERLGYKGHRILGTLDTRCLPPARQRGATGPQEYGVEANDGATERHGIQGTQDTRDIGYKGHWILGTQNTRDTLHKGHGRQRTPGWRHKRECLSEIPSSPSPG